MTGDKKPPEQPAVVGEGQAIGGLAEIIDVVADRVEPLVKLWSNIAESRLKAQQAEDRFRTNVSWVAVVVVSLIVLVAAFLTYQDKMEGSTFGFLLGTIVGYVLTFIRGWIAPSSE